MLGSWTRIQGAGETCPDWPLCHGKVVPFFSGGIFWEWGHRLLAFSVAPLVIATTTYVAVASGWVARAAFYVPSSVPTFVSTYLATQDVRALILVAVNIAIAAAIYLPFVRAYERHAEPAQTPAENAA